MKRDPPNASRDIESSAVYSSPLMLSGPVALFFFIFFRCVFSSLIVMVGYAIGRIRFSIAISM